MIGQDTDETAVVFRLSEGQVTAVFPCIPHDYNGYSMVCYAHVGQHGSASLGWYHTTRAADPEEYRDLMRELEAPPYGYRLKVYERIQQWMHDARAAECRRQREALQG